MFIFIHKSLIDKCKNWDYLIQKTGMLGTMGNKGSCLLRFEINDTSIALSSGHLCAGQGHNSSRISELNDVLTKNFSVHKSKKFSEHDLFFIFGDLNFRNDLDNNSVRNLIANNNLKTLYDFDQFHKIRSVNYSLNILDEGQLNFNPTYKYVIDSDEYEPKRIPSWCDRIFFKKSKMIRQICYNRKEYSYSDHKPVFSIFDVSICKEIAEEKIKLIKYCKRALTFGLNILNKIKQVNDYNDNYEEKNMFIRNQNQNHNKIGKIFIF
jgi:hypothetical protein